MRHRSWMAIAALFLAAAAARADDSGSPAEQGAASTGVARPATLRLLDALRSRQFVEVGEGVRLSAAAVFNGRLYQVKIESRDAKGSVTGAAWATTADLAVDERTRRLKIAMHDGGGKSGDGTGEVQFAAIRMVTGYTPPPELSDRPDGK